MQQAFKTLAQRTPCFFSSKVRRAGRGVLRFSHLIHETRRSESEPSMHVLFAPVTGSSPWCPEGFRTSEEARLSGRGQELTNRSRPPRSPPGGPHGSRGGGGGHTVGRKVSGGGWREEESELQRKRPSMWSMNQGSRGQGGPAGVPGRLGSQFLCNQATQCVGPSTLPCCRIGACASTHTSLEIGHRWFHEA